MTGWSTAKRRSSSASGRVTRICRSAAVTIGLLGVAVPAAAASVTFLVADGQPSAVMHGDVMSGVSFVTPHAAAFIDLQSASLEVQPSQGGHPAAFEYSEGYQTRLKIHKIASYATIPLFATEGVLGQSLYNDPTPGKRTAHLWVATGIGVLFGINTVTGVWNLTEARKDPNGSTRRWVHSVLMLAADAGFFATAVTGPGHRNRDLSAYESTRSLHRSLAFTSITLASVGYGIMLFPHH